MIEIECRGEDPSKCPVRTWQSDGYTTAATPRHVIRHGYDRDAEQRYRCLPCGRTFTLAKLNSSQHNLPKGVSSFHEYLQLEVAWLLHCQGVKVNTAARLAGIDWATARRWHKRAVKKWGSSLCTALDLDEVDQDVADRLFGLTAMGSNGTMSDERWMRAASAAKVLMDVRARRLVTASEHSELRWLCDRSKTFDPDWDDTILDLRTKLLLDTLAPPT